MTSRQRFLDTLNFRKPDRMPVVEWAPWWDKTLTRWADEGMPMSSPYNDEKTAAYFGLDIMKMITITGTASETPKEKLHGAGIITDEASYERIRATLYSDKLIEQQVEEAQRLKARHDVGEFVIRLWLDGFFWFPRILFGIENHLYAFYDCPELMHRINQDLTDYNIRAIEAIFPILNPDMVGFGEDMSYNHGPMISYELFKEFIMPYYQQINPVIKKYGVKVLLDSDGDICKMIPWMLEAGIDGVYPLERQAGVDLTRIREEYPGFLLMGGYDKMVMSKDEPAMRAEFERLLPIMRSGGFISSVDHQTPPEVSMENYKIYMKLFHEYAAKAAI